MENNRSDSGLLICGISHHTAPVEIREKFSLSESQLYPALHNLRQSPGIEEVVVLSTCNRTEFIVWAGNFDAASASIQSFLVNMHQLQPRHWFSFYHFVGAEAINHLFRVASSLDSLIVGEPHITGQFKAAWIKAQQAGACGPFLSHAFQKALNVSKRIRNETAISSAPVSVPYAAVMLAREIFGSLENSSVMLIGSGKMSKISARSFTSAGVSTIWVTNRTLEHALELARELGGIAVGFEQRWKYLAQADVIVSSTGCPHMILEREDAERIRQMRGGRPIFLIDIAVPRDIDPSVRNVPGFFLYDIDDLEQVVAHNLDGRLSAAAEAEKIVQRESQGFKRQLDGQRLVPTIVALRARLEELRREEMAHYQKGFQTAANPDLDSLDALSARLMDRVATELARELKQAPDRLAQDSLASAVRRLFRLSREKEVARTKAGEPAERPALVH